MFKKLLALAVVMMFFSTSVTASARPEAFMPVPVHSSPVFVGGTTRAFDSWSMHGRVFDNAIDQVYFNQFGEGFEFIQNQSTPVNQKVTYGNWELEIISSVAVADRLFESTIFPENLSFTYNEETGEFAPAVYDEESGELILIEGGWEGFEREIAAHVTMYTFFAVRSLSD